MRSFDKLTLAASALAVTVLSSTAAFAGTAPQPTLPAPGIIGLVAGGVIAAIAVARLRK